MPNKKPPISKRFITNMLVILFGIMVLLATTALTYELWFSSADRTSPITIQPIFTPSVTYRIDSGYLCVYDAGAVANHVKQREFGPGLRKIDCLAVECDLRLPIHDGRDVDIEVA